MGQARGAGHVRPHQRACSAHARLVAMHDRSAVLICSSTGSSVCAACPTHRTSVPSETCAPYRSASSARSRA
jgi:hypothetical protein